MRSVPWQPDIAVVNGVEIKTARHALWYADMPFQYVHSGILRQAKPWPAGLLDNVKQLTESYAGTRFNSCVLNLYQDGNEGMGWHSDSEAAYGTSRAITSLSLGATRKFVFKHKRTQEKREVMLRHGQFIVMRGDTQQHWLHAVMKTPSVTSPRISLTFRTFEVGSTTRAVLMPRH